MGRAKGYWEHHSSEWLEVVEFNDIMCPMEEKRVVL